MPGTHSVLHVLVALCPIGRFSRRVKFKKRRHPREYVMVSSSFYFYLSVARFPIHFQSDFIALGGAASSFQ